MTTDIRIEPDVTLRQLQRPAKLRRRERGASAVDTPQLVAALRKVLDGDVLDDPGSLGLVAQDASNYFYVPLALVLPKHREDTIRAVEVCRRFGAPITCRAGATALAGQTCNHAVIFDFSRYMTRILNVDLEGRRATVEPGVICDDLVKPITKHGLTFGPKPATHDRCCFGGMIANNCGGMEAQLAGTAVDNVESLDVLLYDGTLLTLGWMTDAEFKAAGERPGREGELYRALHSLRERTQDLVRARYPQIPRRISGYNLDRLIPDASGRLNVARALVGSEGTCAITLSAEVRLTPLPAKHTVVCVGFRDVFEAADAVPKVLEWKPMICEGLDRRLIQHVQKKHMREAKYLDLLPRGDGWLVIRLGADTQEALDAKAEALCAALKAGHNALDSRVYDDPEHQRGIWKVRESGLGATAFVPGEPDSWPGWEDTAVAPEKLGAYLRDARALFDKYGYDPALYGHFGDGLLHCRVDFELKTARGLEHWKEFLREAAQLVTQKYGGSLSGEHGDGQARGWLLEIMFGPELVQAFREFKAIWDPDGRMNPGKIVDTDPVDAHLRLGAAYDPALPATHFHFPEDNGSFSRATLRCVGVGKCRRTSAEGEAPEDIMCPSYMVTHDEKHCTRGRAHLLWEMMRGQDSPITGGFRDENVKEVARLVPGVQGLQVGMSGQRGHGHVQGRVFVALLVGSAASALRVCVRLDRQVGAFGVVRAGAGELGHARQAHRVARQMGRRHDERSRGAALRARNVRVVVSAPRAFAQRAAARRFVGGHVQQSLPHAHRASGRRRARSSGLRGDRAVATDVLRPAALRLRLSRHGPQLSRERARRARTVSERRVCRSSCSSRAAPRCFATSCRTSCRVASRLSACKSRPSCSPSC